MQFNSVKFSTGQTVIFDW